MFHCFRLSARGPNRVRRKIGLALLAGAVAAWGGAWAQADWPSKAVRIIVPFAPGGGADSSARVLADILAPELGQPVIVENKPGAGSAIGVTYAAQSKDGHTLLMGSNSMVINPSLNSDIAYNVARDFDAIGMVSSQPLVLVVPATSAIHSLDDLIAQAKAHPGELTAGNSGNGTLAHLTAELFSIQTQTVFTPVPYKGESGLMPDLISGRVSMGFLNLPSVITHIRSGRLHALAVSAPEPVPELPDVPTFRSLGFPDLEVQGWAALLAPKGIPAPGRAKLERLLTQALNSEQMKKSFEGLSVRPFIMGSAQTDAYLKAEGARWAEVIKSRGIQIGK